MCIIHALLRLLRSVFRPGMGRRRAGAFPLAPPSGGPPPLLVSDLRRATGADLTSTKERSLIPSIPGHSTEVDMAFWDFEGRRDAAAAGQELLGALAAFGIELDDIEIIEPCQGCERVGFRLSLGTVSLGTAREYAAALRVHAPSV